MNYSRFQKITAFTLSVLLLFSGCSPAVTSDKTSPKTFANQIEHKDKNFSKEQKLFDAITDNTVYFSLKNTPVLKGYVDSMKDSLIKYLDTNKDSLNIDDDTLKKTKMGILLFISQLKQFDELNVFVSVNGQELNNGVFPAFLKDYDFDNDSFEEDQALEIIRYLNDNVCIAAELKTTHPIVKENIHSLTEKIKTDFYESDPENENLKKLKEILNFNISSPEEDIFQAVIGKCDQGFSFDKVKIDSTVVLVEKFSMQYNQELKTSLKEIYDKYFDFVYSKSDDNQKEIIDSIIEISKSGEEKLREYHSSQIAIDTFEDSYFIDFQNDHFTSKRITSIKEKQNRDIFFDYILGESIKKPYYLTNTVDYVFSLQEKEKTLYSFHQVKGKDDSISGPLIGKSYIDYQTSNNVLTPLVFITVIGVLATGATAVYSSAQAKARDATRIVDLDIIEGATRVYQIDNKGQVPKDIYDWKNKMEGDFVKFTPYDPKTGEYYGYHVNGNDFCFTTNLESPSNDYKELNDGGIYPDLYEVGDMPNCYGNDEKNVIEFIEPIESIDSLESV